MQQLEASQLSQNTLAQFFLLKTNASYLTLAGEFKTKNHLISYLNQDILCQWEWELIQLCTVPEETINYEPKDLDSKLSSGTK